MTTRMIKNSQIQGYSKTITRSIWHVFMYQYTYLVLFLNNRTVCLSVVTTSASWWHQSTWISLISPACHWIEPWGTTHTQHLYVTVYGVDIRTFTCVCSSLPLLTGHQLCSHQLLMWSASCGLHLTCCHHILLLTLAVQLWSCMSCWTSWYNKFYWCLIMKLNGLNPTVNHSYIWSIWFELI